MSGFVDAVAASVVMVGEPATEMLRVFRLLARKSASDVRTSALNYCKIEVLVDLMRC